MLAIDEKLFNQWKSGEVDAKEKVFKQLWEAVSPELLAFCQRMGCRQDEAETLVRDGFRDAMFEIHKKVIAGGMTWSSEKNFVHYLKQRIIWRIKDILRREAAKRLISIFEPIGQGMQGQQLTWLDVICVWPPDLDPEEEVKEERAKIAKLSEILLTLRDSTKGGSRDILDAIISYLKQQLAITIDPQLNPADVDIYELIKKFNPSVFRFEKSEMYQFILEQLRINRNTLDQRMKRIRPILLKMRLESIRKDGGTAFPSALA